MLLWGTDANHSPHSDSTKNVVPFGLVAFPTETEQCQTAGFSFEFMCSVLKDIQGIHQNLKEISNFMGFAGCFRGLHGKAWFRVGICALERFGFTTIWGKNSSDSSAIEYACSRVLDHSDRSFRPRP